MASSSQLENATISWSGEVENVREYRTDSDFGSGPGVKATVLIGRLGESRLVSNQIHAIVGLPPDAVVERQRDISFSGTLLRIDRYMRNLYVADAVVDREGNQSVA